MQEDLVIWKDIPGYEGKYQVSTNGRVRKYLKHGRFREMSVFKKSESKKRYGDRPLVHLTNAEGKDRQHFIMRLVIDTFMDQPEGTVAYHKNGIVTDNWIGNIGFTDRKTLGQKNGHKSVSRPVAKIDRSGEIVDVYRSAREAARENHMSKGIVAKYCNGYYNQNGIRRKTTTVFAPDGYAYAWDDEREIYKARRRILKEIKAER